LVGIINGQATAMDRYAQATHVGDIATALWSLLREAGLSSGAET
jgi:hypothetical protein